MRNIGLFKYLLVKPDLKSGETELNCLRSSANAPLNKLATALVWIYKKVSLTIQFEWFWFQFQSLCWETETTQASSLAIKCFAKLCTFFVLWLIFWFDLLIKMVLNGPCIEECPIPFNYCFFYPSLLMILLPYINTLSCQNRTSNNIDQTLTTVRARPGSSLSWLSGLVNSDTAWTYHIFSRFLSCMTWFRIAWVRIARINPCRWFRSVRLDPL